ncbi:MAG: hypothetical protein ACE5OQ_16855 [Woeseia sp.]
MNSRKGPAAIDNSAGPQTTNDYAAVWFRVPRVTGDRDGLEPRQIIAARDQLYDGICVIGQDAVDGFAQGERFDSAPVMPSRSAAGRRVNCA